jgi:dihydrofolate synthase/folylpolyglutamate synthase
MLPSPAEEVIKQTCRTAGAPLFKLRKRDFEIDSRRLTLDFVSASFRFRNLEPALIGVHQLRNCALALEAASLLKERGIKLTRRAVEQGVRSTYWPGRFQIIKRPGRPLLVLDVGHNAGGVAAFVDSFRLKFPGRKADIIAGFVMRKRHDEMFASLSHIAQSFVLVPLKTRRSSDPGELMATIRWRGVPVRKDRSVLVAYERLLKSASPDDIIVIIGSHYLVGEFLASGGDRS